MNLRRPVFPFLPHYRLLFIDRVDLCQLDGWCYGHAKYQDHFTYRHATASVDRNMYSKLGIHDQQVSCGIRPSRE